MPPLLKLDKQRAIEIAWDRISPRIGCGLMLKELPRYNDSDALLNVMEHYGFNRLAADRPAREVLENKTLLKAFHDNAFEEQIPLRPNFRKVYAEHDIWLAFDPRVRRGWFVGAAEDRLALDNYYRDALLLGLKPHGLIVEGATARLTALGWQNISELLTDRFFIAHRDIQRVEIMGAITGVRWRWPVLALGTLFLNFKDFETIKAATEAVLRGEDGGEFTG